MLPISFKSKEERAGVAKNFPQSAQAGLKWTFLFILSISLLSGSSFPPEASLSHFWSCCCLLVGHRMRLFRNFALVYDTAAAPKMNSCEATDLFPFFALFFIRCEENFFFIFSNIFPRFPLARMCLAENSFDFVCFIFSAELGEKRTKNWIRQNFFAKPAMTAAAAAAAVEASLTKM